MPHLFRFFPICMETMQTSNCKILLFTNNLWLLVFNCTNVCFSVNIRLIAINTCMLCLSPFMYICIYLATCLMLSAEIQISVTYLQLVIVTRLPRREMVIILCTYSSFAYNCVCICTVHNKLHWRVRGFSSRIF